MRHPAALPLLTLALALSLVALGGVVHTTGSSLACPDWPLCNGDWMPIMRGGVEYEHSHRLLALLVGVASFGLPFWMGPTMPALRRLGWIAAILVVLQALLGAATVLLRLPPPISVAHLCTATVLVLLLGVLSTRALAPAPLPARPGAAAFLNVVLGLWFLQVGLGALVRHLGAAPACGTDALLCDGPLELTHSAVLLQLTHRTMGALVLALILYFSVRTERDPLASSATRWGARTALGMVLLQVGLGMAAIAGALSLSLVTLHLLGAQLLGLTLIVLRVRIGSPGRAASSSVGDGLLAAQHPGVVSDLAVSDLP